MQVEYYCDHRGRYPVFDYIHNLSSEIELNQITTHLRELERQGYRLHRPMAAMLRDGIYELRPGHNRILYGFVEGNIVLLHAFRKTRNNIHDRDIESLADPADFTYSDGVV